MQNDLFRSHAHTTARRYVNFVGDGGGNISGGGTDGGTGMSNEVNPAGGSETRPKNAYVHFIIKGFDQ